MDRGAMTSEMMEFTNDIFMDYTYNYKDYTSTTIKNTNGTPYKYKALDTSFIRVDGANYYQNATTKDI